MQDKISYTVADAVKATGIGRTTLYKLFKDGEIVPVKLGNRTLIRRADLEALVERHVRAV